ncbi:MAG: hypothetical protein AAFW95_15650, partial [Cyanobacteria bacterium J06638_6]
PVVIGLEGWLEALQHLVNVGFCLSGDLIEIEASTARSAKSYINQMLEGLKPALQANDDWDVVYPTVQSILTQGNAASRQRQWLEDTGDLRQVVDHLIEETARTESPSRILVR